MSLTASLAAVYTVFRLIPLSRFIGGSGVLTVSGMVTPIIGLLIEPEYGVLAVFIGTMVASFAPWNPLRFAGLDFIPGALNLLVVSLAVRGRRILASLVLLGTIAAFVLTPYTSVFVGSNLESPPLPFFWMHLLALGILVSPLSKWLLAGLRSANYSRIAVGVGVLAFAGTMTEHISGGILYALFFGPGAIRAWPLIYLAYPVERIAIVVGAVLISVPFILATRAWREELLSYRTRQLAHTPP
jgi:hypothetical protein